MRGPVLPPPLPHRRPAGPVPRVVVALAVAATLLALLAAPGGARPVAPGGRDGGGGDARTGQAGAAPLEVAAASPWVAADGVFQVRFAPSDRVRPDDVLSWAVHQRLSADDDGGLRDELDGVLEGDGAGPVLRPRVEVPVAELGDPTAGLVLDVAVRSRRDGSERVLLPSPGVHPVTLRLEDAGGDERWSEVVFLNRLPADPVVGGDDRPGVVPVSLVLALDAGPSVTADGSVDLDVGERAAIAAAARLLTQVPDAPVALAVRPNVLDALGRSEEPADERALEAFRTARRGRPVIQTYVPVDTGALVEAGGRRELVAELDLGSAVTGRELGTAPATTTLWFDDSVTPAVLPVLRGVGVERVVVSADRLRMPSGSAPDTATTRLSRLEGTGMTALASDGELTLRLVDANRSPGMRAHTVVTSLMTSWFDAAEAARRSFPGPASALLVPPQTDPDALAALVAALDAGGPLAPGSDAASPPDADAVAEVDGRALVSTLTPRAVPDESRALAANRETGRVVAAYRSMTGDADPMLGLWEVLGAETLSDRADEGTRAALHQTVRDGVTARVGAITAPTARRVLLTAREGRIPLRFDNDLPFPVRLRLAVRSPRLEVRGPERRTVVLEPGQNRIDVPVGVQAPGQSLLRIEATSPDGGLTVPTEPVPVASTTISGVGAALSVLSLLFLALWWLRTHRRSRRERASSGHPAGRPALPPAPAAGPRATDPPEHPDAPERPTEGDAVAVPPIDRPTAEVPAVDALGERDRRG